MKMLGAVHWLCIVLALTAATPMSAAAQKLRTKFGAAAAYPAGSGPISVVIADLRGNGKRDLVAANYCQTSGQNSCSGTGQVAVLLGNGDGTYQPAVAYSTGAYYANSVAVADVNGDGIPDLVVADFCQYSGCQPANGAVSVLLGNGDGTFQPATVYDSGGYEAYSVAIADLRGNSKLDLLVSNSDGEVQYQGYVGVLLGNGNGTFQPAVSYGSGWGIASSLAVGDVDRNGIPDLVVANFCGGLTCYPRTGEVGVLLGNGDGTFQSALLYDSGGEFALSLAVGDLRGNGTLDVAVANEFSDNEGKRLHGELGVLLGDGNGTFQPAATYAARGAEYPSFPATGGGGYSLAIGDVNGDGIPDLVAVEWCKEIVSRNGLVCESPGQVNVMLGNGDGTFQAPIAYGSGGYIGSAVAIADINGDGRPDIVATNWYATQGDYSNGTVAVLLNETSYHARTVLTSTPNPAQVNQAVTFTATITSTPPIPNGETVTFYNGKTQLGTAKTANGAATMTTSFSAAGKYTIKAAYSGDGFRKPSSGRVKQVVNP